MKILIIFLILITSFLVNGEKVMPLIKNGESAPVFMLPSVDGSRISIRDYCGKLRNTWKNKKKHILIVSFMATYCLPCRHEIPQLEAYSKIAPDDVKIIYISVDSLGLSILKPFKERMKIENIILNDKYGKVMQRFGVKKLPSLFIIDKEGKIQFQSLNGLPSDLDLKAALIKKVAAMRGNIIISEAKEDIKSSIKRLTTTVDKKKIINTLLSGKSKDFVIKKFSITTNDLEKVILEAKEHFNSTWN